MIIMWTVSGILPEPASVHEKPAHLALVVTAWATIGYDGTWSRPCTVVAYMPTMVYTTDHVISIDHPHYYLLGV